MFNYVLIFLFLFAVSILFYLLYERFVKTDKKSDSALYVEALKDLLDGKHESAFTKLRQVVAEDSTNIDAYLRLGQILREYNKPDRAIQVHKDLTLRSNLTNREKEEILKQLFQNYSALNDFDMAHAALKELITINSENKWAFVSLLKLLEKQQKWDEAYNTAAKLLKLESNKSKKPLAVFKFHLAKDLHKKREFHKARIMYKESIGLDPAYVPAYLAIGDSYYEENRFEDAVNYWNKLIDAVPSEGHLVIERLKKTLFDLGRFGDLAEICHNILEHSPKNIEARFMLAEFYEKKGELDRSEQMLNTIFDDYPDNTRVTLELIRLYLEKDDTRKIRDLLKVIEGKRDRQKDNVGDSSLVGTG